MGLYTDRTVLGYHPYLASLLFTVLHLITFLTHFSHMIIVIAVLKLHPFSLILRT